MTQTPTDTLDLATLPFWLWDSFPQPEGAAREVNTGIPLDSLLPHRELPDTVVRPSMFKHHTLQVEHGNMLPRQQQTTPAWVFSTLVVIGALLCVYYRLHKVRVGQLGKALFDSRAADRLVRDCNLNRNVILLPMGLLVVAALCLPAHAMAIPESGLPGYLLLASATALLYVLRNGVMRLLGNIFEQQQEVKQLITGNYLFHLATATVLMLLIPLFFYLPGARNVMLVVLAVFVGLAFASRLFQGMKVFLTQSNGHCFYLFYYLCIVESIPILALLKWFILQ